MAASTWRPGTRTLEAPLSHSGFNGRFGRGRASALRSDREGLAAGALVHGLRVEDLQPSAQHHVVELEDAPPEDRRASVVDQDAQAERLDELVAIGPLALVLQAQLIREPVAAAGHH